MSQVAVPIQGTFDVAIARNALRRKIAESAALPALSARAAAALTAMAELILFSHSPGTIEITLIERPGAAGVELGCETNWVQNRQVWIGQAHRWLERVADEMQVMERPNGLYLIARVWIDHSNGKDGRR